MDIWLTCGDIGGTFGESPAGIFQHSEDGGATWATIADVLEVYAFGFGVTASGASYPTLFIAGSVNHSLPCQRNAQSTQYLLYEIGSEHLIHTRPSDAEIRRSEH